MYNPRVQRLAIWDKFLFSLWIVPLVIHMIYFSYPQLLSKSIILKNPKISFPNKIPDPKLSSAPLGFCFNANQIIYIYFEAHIWILFCFQLSHHIAVAVQ